MGVIGPPEGIAYIIAKLQAAAGVTSYTTQIYRDTAPLVAINNPPYILVRYQGGHDVLGSFADRIMADGSYQAAVYGPNSQHDSLLIPIAAAMDAALHRTSGTAQGGTIIAAWRTAALDIPEVVSGADETWMRVGGLYRLLVT